VTPEPGVQGRAAQLRERFDGAFSRPPVSAPTDLHDLLLISVGVGRHALRLADVAALHVDVAVMHLPSSQPAQLGVASFRRRLVPVFDLRFLLGTPGIGVPRWLVLTKVTGHGPAVGLAFDGFDGHARVQHSALITGVADNPDAHRFPELVRIAGVPRAVVNVASLIDVIRESANIPRPSKEQQT